MTHQLTRSKKQVESSGSTHISATEAEEVAAHGISNRELKPEMEIQNPETCCPDDATWALVEHIVEDAIMAMEEAIQYVGQTSKRLLLFSLSRSYRRIQSIRDKRGLYTIDDVGSLQYAIADEGTLGKYL